MPEKDEYYRRKVESESKREKRRAERLLNRIKEPSFVIQFLLVLCTGGLIVVGYFQYLILARTDQTLRAIRRPWITAKLEIIGDFVSNEKGATVNLRYTFKNVGNSPAFNVFGFADIEPNPQQMTSLLSFAFVPDPAKALKAHCARVTEATTGTANTFGEWFGDAIFPDESIITDDRAIIDRSKEVLMPSGVSSLTPPQPELKFTSPIIVTFCVDYQSSLESSHHQTAQVFNLTRKGAAEGTIQQIDPDKPGTIPAAELILSKPILWGYRYAN